VIRQLRQCGLKVPADVSLVGFDNEDETITGDIGVTSLEVNTAAMCELTMNTIIQHLESEAYTPLGSSFVDGKIIVKQSIAAPKP
jgi:DNA-binding LacI/PurR family transcriptional regulator